MSLLWLSPTRTTFPANHFYVTHFLFFGNMIHVKLSSSNLHRHPADYADLLQLSSYVTGLFSTELALLSAVRHLFVTLGNKWVCHWPRIPLLGSIPQPFIICITFMFISLATQGNLPYFAPIGYMETLPSSSTDDEPPHPFDFRTIQVDNHQLFAHPLVDLPLSSPDLPQTPITISLYPTPSDLAQQNDIESYLQQFFYILPYCPNLTIPAFYSNTRTIFS